MLRTAELLLAIFGAAVLAVAIVLGAVLGVVLLRDRLRYGRWWSDEGTGDRG